MSNTALDNVKHKALVNVKHKVNKEAEEEDKSEIEISQLLHTMKTIIFIENMIGKVRFRFVNGKLEPPDLKFKVFSLLLVVTTIVLFYLYSKSGLYCEKYKLIDVILEVPVMIAAIQYVVATIATSFLMNETNIRIIKTFADLDRALRVDLLSDFYKESQCQTNFYTVSFIISCLINILLLLGGFGPSLYQFILVSIYLTQRLDILSFFIMIVNLRNRLMIINIYLTKFTENKDVTNISIIARKIDEEVKFNNFIGKPSSSNVQIHYLGNTYDLIGEICSMINEIFNFQIFMTLVGACSCIIINIWKTLRYYQSPEHNCHAFELFDVIYSCFNIVYVVAIISYACERVLMARKETRLLVNKIVMNYDLPKSMRVQAKAFMELIEVWPLTISIYNLYVVDLTLMLKFISLATTYLILIIQISHYK